jgi:oleate hydratase
MSKYYFVGSGIASLAGAAYLIHDGNINGTDITSSRIARVWRLAGCAWTPQTGYFMSGSRMFEHKYNATFDLFSFIPSASDPNLSVKQETELAEKDALWHNKARLVNGEGKIIEFHKLGFSEKERIDLLALMAKIGKVARFKAHYGLFRCRLLSYELLV